MMFMRNGWRMAALVVVLVLVASPAFAGPYVGDWSLGWHGARDCPRGCYSPLHYWLPSAYRVGGRLHPATLEEYPPGPAVCVQPSYQFNAYPCRMAPPMPSAPYADPASYYGRPIVPARE